MLPPEVIEKMRLEKEILRMGKSDEERKVEDELEKIAEEEEEARVVELAMQLTRDIKDKLKKESEMAAQNQAQIPSDMSHPEEEDWLVTLENKVIFIYFSFKFNRWLLLRLTLQKVIEIKNELIQFFVYFYRSNVKGQKQEGAFADDTTT